MKNIKINFLNTDLTSVEREIENKNGLVVFIDNNKSLLESLYIEEQDFLVQQLKGFFTLNISSIKRGEYLGGTFDKGVAEGGGGCYSVLLNGDSLKPPLQGEIKNWDMSSNDRATITFDDNIIEGEYEFTAETKYCGGSFNKVSNAVLRIKSIHNISAYSLEERKKMPDGKYMSEVQNIKMMTEFFKSTKNFVTGEESLLEEYLKNIYDFVDIKGIKYNSIAFSRWDDIKNQGYQKKLNFSNTEHLSVEGFSTENIGGAPVLISFWHDWEKKGVEFISFEEKGTYFQPIIYRLKEIPFSQEKFKDSLYFFVKGEIEITELIRWGWVSRFRPLIPETNVLSEGIPVKYWSKVKKLAGRFNVEGVIEYSTLLSFQKGFKTFLEGVETEDLKAQDCLFFNNFVLSDYFGSEKITGKEALVSLGFMTKNKECNFTPSTLSSKKILNGIYFPRPLGNQYILKITGSWFICDPRKRIIKTISKKGRENFFTKLNTLIQENWNAESWEPTVVTG